MNFYRRSLSLGIMGLFLFSGLTLSRANAAESKCSSSEPKTCIEEANEALKKQDIGGARTLFQKGCDGNIARACLKAGILAEQAGDIPTAKTLYQRACDVDKRKDCPNVQKAGAPRK